MYNQFVQGYGSLTPPLLPLHRNFAIFIGLAGQSYNSVSTAMQNCDSLFCYISVGLLYFVLIVSPVSLIFISTMWEIGWEEYSWNDLLCRVGC